MSTRYGPVKLRVPKGFPVLLQRFAREVLREQPLDIAKFGAEYFQHLHLQKLQTGEDPLKGDPFDEPGFKAVSERVLRPISSATRQNEIKQELAATKIQAGYRGYHVRRTSKKKREEELQAKHKVAATKIQANYRGYRTRKNMKSKHQYEDETEETFETKEDVNEHQYGDDENNAAIRIQANYRGYQTRKSFTYKQEEKKEEEPIINTSDPEMEAAALKIQASFRGHQARKSLKDNEDHEETAGSEGEPEREEEESEDLKMDEGYKMVNEEETEDIVEVGDEVEQQEEQTEDLVEDEEEHASEGEMNGKREAAALKIQASYRGYSTRKNLKEKANSYDAPKVEEADPLAGGDRVTDDEKEDVAMIDENGGQGDISDHEENKEVRFAPEVTVEDTTESEDIGKKETAAVKIQAQYRGYKTRKDMKAKQEAVQPQASDDASQRITEEED